mgnify:FL=1
MSQFYNIVIAGEAGQGLLTVGNILSKALVRCGYPILVTKAYMSRIRGGHNTFAIRAGDAPVPGPGGTIDLLVALNAESVEIQGDYVSEQGLIMCSGDVNTDRKNVLRVPFDELADKKTENIAALGVISGLLDLDTETVLGTMTDIFGSRHPEMEEKNREAFTGAESWTRDQETNVSGFFKAPEDEKKLLLDGNQAISLGAVSAGVKFCSFYPMTPATSIVQALINCKKEAGLEVLQVEDEIAAVNMALGAAFAGKPAMCATSGGGFALMTEGVSLAGITETPLVTVIAQRPGPATGLPTRTEQADLEFVLCGGHGEFPRVIFAPATVEDCFHLTRKAFALSDRYQTPIFILTDQFLADSLRPVAVFEDADLNALCPVLSSSEDVETPYKRFAFTDSGVSPRLVPGQSEHLVGADSDEHSEDGHITEDHDTRNRMVEKRLKKMDGIRSEVIAPRVEGDDNPDLLLVTWGSTFGAVLEAADILREQGTSTAVMTFTQVWPLVPDQFTDLLEQAKKTVCVEQNATAQFRKLLRRETGINMDAVVLRYDGLPMTSSYITRKLTDLED